MRQYYLGDVILKSGNRVLAVMMADTNELYNAITLREIDHANLKYGDLYKRHENAATVRGGKYLTL